MSRTAQQQVGASVENFACQYLQQQGLSLVEHNFRCRVGEVDLIMRDQETLVFIEVRYRASSDYGSSIESIHRAKQNKLVKTAFYYLQRHALFEKIPCRFDVIGVTAPLEAANVTWIKNAFGVSPWT